MKVLFLDIDGVLNSKRSVVAFGGCPFTVDSEVSLDTVALALIRQLHHRGVKIVISSSWRILHSLYELEKYLKMDILGMTPRIQTIGSVRGNEIEAWLGRHGAGVGQYVIVDDDSDMLPSQMEHFVKTDHDEGLSWKNYEKICEILDIPPFDFDGPRSTDAASKD